MAKKHFTGVGKVKIHTAREGTCDSFGACNYQDNTPASPVPKPRQSHHILCVSSTIKYKSLPDLKKDAKTIDAVYRKTTWCVNQTPNLKWLPLKGTYSKVKNNYKSGKRVPRGEADVWGLDLPCHDWDHNCKQGYTNEVELAFTKYIWDEIKSAQEDGLCPDEIDVTANFKNLEDKMKQRLLARGKRGGGTRKSIKNEGKPRWWYAFSMAKTAIARDRPVNAFGLAPDPPKALSRTGR